MEIKCLLTLFTIYNFVPFSCQSTGQFWHVTDMHWDANYSSHNGDPSKRCWAVTSKSTEQLMDIGKYGNYACDSPWTLVTSTMHFMKSRLSRPDFILWTGDDNNHAPTNLTNRKKTKDAIRQLTSIITETFPRTPVVPTFGNWDVYPGSQFSVQPFNEWYREVADIWQPWLGQQAYQSFRLGGYYTRPHPTVSDVTIVALNTNVFSNYNPLVNETVDQDPLDQLSWLNSTLTRLTICGQKAYLTAHIPPGVSGSPGNYSGTQWFQPLYNHQFIKIVTQHADTVIGQFYGHEHTDSFKLFYDDQGKIINSLFVVPSVTPYTDINPSVRLFTYDLHTGQILNYEQYYLNLTEANEIKAANWQLEYDFLSAYNLPDMSHQSIGSLVDSFRGPNETLFNKYVDYNTVSCSVGGNCTEECRKGLLCAIIQLSVQDFKQCMESQ